MPYDCTNATLVKSTTAKINAMQMIALATIVIVTVIMQRNFRKPQPASRVSYAACESSRRQGDESERGSAQGIEVKGKKREPSDAELVEAHQKYMTALQKLFEDNKSKYGVGDRNLQVI